MPTKLWLGVIFSTSALAACGGGGGDADAPITPHFDSTPVADGPPGAPDADPNAPDAVPGAFACNGQPNPTTAPATINITGTTVELGAGGTMPVIGTTVDLFATGNPTPVATTTSSGATAAFAFNGLPTGGNALDGFGRGTFPPTTMGDPRKVVYLYPAQPIHADVDNFLVTTASNNIVNLINLAYANPDQDDANGAVGVEVTDCLGNPLAGATVTSNPAGTQVLYRNAAGQPDPTATSTGPDGIGIIFNVPPGASVVIDAGYQGYDMRQHTMPVKKLGPPDNALTTTIVMP